jgi:hypothetical protein
MRSLPGGSALKPANPEALHRLARIRQKQGQINDARGLYQQCLSLQPDRVISLNNLAVLEMGTGDLETATQLLQQAWAVLISQIPAATQPASGLKEWALVLNTSCQLALQRADFVTAKHHAVKLCKVDPGLRSLTNLAVSLAMNQQPRAAIKAQLLGLGCEPTETTCMDQCIERLLWSSAEQPLLSAERHRQLVNLATFVLHENPRRRLGWSLLLASLGSDPVAWMTSTPPWRQLWDGQWTTELCIWDEQGFGDSLQNLRWLPAVAKQTSRLTVLMRPSLLPVLKHRMDLPQHCCLAPLTGQTRPWERPGQHLPITALTAVMAGDPIEVCGDAYLRCNRLHDPLKQPLRIGFAWAAGAKADAEARRAAALRSVPPQQFLSWIRDLSKALPRELGRDCHWSCLQLGPDLVPWGGWLSQQGISLLNPDGDWHTTATALEPLHAVISVDTAVAHLAGAMGLPTITLLNTPCDWRWGQQGSHTPWYDSWVMARCQTPNAWNGALQTAGTALREILRRCKPTQP